MPQKHLFWICLPVMFSTPLFAQTLDDDTQDQIIVVHERRPAVEAPIPFTQIRLEADIFEAPQAFSETAGVNIQSGSGQESLTAIRSPVLTGGSGAGSFAYLINNISARSAGFANTNAFLDMPFELAGKVELITGPAGFLYGGNAQHGAINLVTDGADDRRDASLTLGENELISARGFIGNGQVSAALALTHDGGFRDDSGVDSQKLLIEADGGTIGSWQLSGGASFVNLNQETAGFAQGVDAYKDRGVSRANPNPEAFRDSRNLLAWVKLERDTENGGIELKPYIRNSDMRFRLHFLPGQAIEQTAHQSVGLDSYLYGDNAAQNLSWAAGALIDFTSGNLDEIQDAPTVFSYVQGTHYDFDVTELRVSPWSQLSYELTDELDIQGSLRAEYVRYDYDNQTADGVVGRFLRSADRQDEFIPVSADLALVYNPSSQWGLRARLVKSERAPIISDLYRVQRFQTGDGADIETLSGVDAELAVRPRLGNFSVAFYHYDKDGFFFRDADGFNVTDGKTRHQGIELKADMDLGELSPVFSGFSLRGNSAFERHTYEFTRQVTNNSERITAGNDVDTAPRSSAYAALRYEDFDWSAELSAQHMGRYYTNAANTQDYPGHTVWGLRGSYDLRDDVTVTGRIENLFDTRYADRADFAFGSERYFPGRPRALYLTVSYRH